MLRAVSEACLLGLLVSIPTSNISAQNSESLLHRGYYLQFERGDLEAAGHKAFQLDRKVRLVGCILFPTIRN